MTSSERPAAQGPAGMPAHLWELAKSDVRLSVPNRVRNAVANGLNAPEGVRRIAARVAVTGAALGVPAAIIGLGGFLDAADAPVDLAGGESPLDGVDGAPAMPGSYDGGAGPGGGHGYGGSGGGHGGADGADGFAHSTTHSDGGDVQSGLGSTWHVQDPSVPGGDWLTVQMFQDVTVTETADGMFVVDAWQFIVIHDSHGQEYTFKEHYQVIVPDPPGQETDLVIHEHGFVHVTERPDGTFAVDPHFGIDVLVTDDGDGRDEVTIGQTQHVRYTDTDGRTDDDVTVDLSEKATSTSDDTGDKATTTIDQDQVFDDGTKPEQPWSGGSRQTNQPETTVRDDRQTTDRETGEDDRSGHDGGTGTSAESGTGGVDPSSPFGEEPADRGAGQPGSPSAPTGTGTAQPTTQPATSAASAARPIDPAPMSSAVVAAPAAAVLAGEGPLAAGPELDEPPSAVAAHDDPAPTGQDGQAGATPQDPAPDPATGHGTPATDGTTGPFAGSPQPGGETPFETQPTGTAPESSTPTTDPATTSTSDDRTEPGDNTPVPGHESPDDPSNHATVPPEPVSAEHDANHDTGHDPADHGTDGADHALVG